MSTVPALQADLDRFRRTVGERDDEIRELQRKIAVAESARAHSYHFSKQLQKTC